MDQDHTTRRTALRMLAGAILVPAGLLGMPEGVAASKGRRLAKYALRFEGKPYVWAGSSPKSGFDCSGLTKYAVLKVYDRDITQSVELQWKHGRKVKRGKWKPGDLVFFKNTYKPGLSHVGIYIGRNRFVHAENERTGVVVTDMNSTYYSERYAGAKRL
jgi:cell wall-associated NlpC family hydrolase